MIVFRINFEGLGDEGQFWSGIIELGKEQSTMVPDLICLEMLDS